MHSIHVNFVTSLCWGYKEKELHERNSCSPAIQEMLKQTDKSLNTFLFIICLFITHTDSEDLRKKSSLEIILRTVINLYFTTRQNSLTEELSPHNYKSHPEPHLLIVILNVNTLKPNLKNMEDGVAFLSCIR